MENKVWCGRNGRNEVSEAGTFFSFLREAYEDKGIRQGGSAHILVVRRGSTESMLWYCECYDIVNVMILERKDWWKLSREINTPNHLLKQSPKLTRGWRIKIPRILSEYCAGCSVWCRHEKENPFRGREVSSMTSWKRWCSLRSRSNSFMSQAQLRSCRSHMTTPSGAQWIMTENTKPLPGREMLSPQV